MSKLLNANFSRLIKSKSFWLCAVSTLILSCALIYSSADSAAATMESGFITSLDKYYFQMAPFIGLIMAFFISFFLGVEYSDGTLRNKLVVGYTRTQIYLANFLTCTTAGIIIVSLWFIGGLPGLFLIGNFEMGLSGAAAYFFVAVGFSMAFCAIFVSVSMNSGNKALTLVFTILLWAAMIFAASGLNDRLDEPEINGGMAMIDGEFVMMDSVPNPLYLSGTVRLICELALRLLPTGQAIVMTDAEITFPLFDILASLSAALLITGAGILSFGKKDLK